MSDAVIEQHDMSDVFVVMGFTQVMLFNGAVAMELLMLDTLTGEDFTVSVPEEAVMELVMRRERAGKRAEPTESGEVVEDGQEAPERAQDVVRDAVRDPVEADQF